MTQLVAKSTAPSLLTILIPPLHLCFTHLADPADSVWANSPRQMWPSRVWWSLPGFTQWGPAETIVHNLATQQVAGRSRMSGAFEEKSIGAKCVGIVGVYRVEREEAGGLSGSPQRGSLIKIFNTSERPCFDSFEGTWRWKRGPGWVYTPNQQEKGGKKGGVGELRMRVEKTNDWIERSTVFNNCWHWQI